MQYMDPGTALLDGNALDLRWKWKIFGFPRQVQHASYEKRHASELLDTFGQTGEVVRAVASVTRWKIVQGNIVEDDIEEVGKVQKRKASDRGWWRR